MISKLISTSAGICITKHMAGIELVFDLSIIMLVAAGMTLLFSWLRQPLILGYLLAGIVIGLIAPQLNILTDTTLISYIADIGIVFLMFTLGLEFTLGRLREIGLFAIAIGTIEMLMMIGIGFWTGLLLGFPENASLLLGAVMAISSTAIIVKSMQEFGLVTREHSKIVVGVLVVEDVAAVVILGLISGLESTGSVTVASLLQTIISMILFLIASMAIGLLFIPRIISRVSRTRPAEVVLIVSLGICFGLSVLSSMFGFSLAIGAFIAGMLIGESEDADIVVLKTTPLREMFVAVFFVTMGLMFEPGLIGLYLVPVVVVMIFFVLGKSLLISVGTFMFGFPAKTALLAGSSMIALGEFSLIICRSGVDAGLAGEYLYSITVLVATVTAFALPLSVKNGERLYDWLLKRLSPEMRASIYHLQRSLISARLSTKRSPEVADEWNRRAVSSLIDIALISIVAIVARTVFLLSGQLSAYIGVDTVLFNGIVFVLSAAVVIPPAMDLARNTEHMISLVIRHAPGGYGNHSRIRTGLKNLLRGFVIAIIGILLMLIALPWAVDPEFHKGLSPVVFVFTLVVIVFLAWYLNRTIYRSFCEIVQRDIMREHVSVGTGAKSNDKQSTEPRPGTDMSRKPGSEG